MTEAAVQHRGEGFQRYRAREVDRELRRKDRAELAAIRDKLRQLRAGKRARVRAAMDACRTARLRMKEKAARARQKLRAYIARQKAETAGQCVSSREHEREAGTRSIASVAAERDRLRADIRLRRRAEGARLRERLSKREARGESDDEVRGNIPRELAPVWERVKARIHAGPRRSRTEAFLEWVHDNSASVERYLNEAVEHDVEELARQEAAHYANPRRRARTKGTGQYAFTRERRCVCGHALGHHSAERVKHEGRIVQECLAGELIGDSCDCECFTPAKRNPRTDGGDDVRTLTDSDLRILIRQAWNLSNNHDLRVLRAELARRGLAERITNPRRRNPRPVPQWLVTTVDADGERERTGWYERPTARDIVQATGRRLLSATVRGPGGTERVYTSPELERASSMRNPTKKRRNPYVAGSTVEGQLVPGTFRWNRRGIGNPGRPSSTHGRRLAFFANMAKGALRKGDRAAALEWRRKFLAERKNPAPATRRAPPGNPDRFASRRSGWAALADARPAAAGYAASAMRLNPRTPRELTTQRLRDIAAELRAGRRVSEATMRTAIGNAVRAGVAPATVTSILGLRRNPLSRGFSRASIAKNIKREQRRGVRRGQAVAIALSVARKAAKKKLGRIPKYLQKRNPHEGAQLERLFRAAQAQQREGDLAGAVRTLFKADELAASIRPRTPLVEKTRVTIARAVDAITKQQQAQQQLRAAAKKNPRRRKSPKKAPAVGWWRATIYGPGGKVVHRQVARANPAQARASVAALAKRHGRVALDGPFVAKPAC